VSGEWVYATGFDPERVILYLHGGGYISGSPQTYRMLIAQIARAADARVLAPDYRLAPEHPYPAALEDVQTAYFWLLEQGVAPENIVVAGDSAGGGLTIALMLTLRETGAPLPAGGVCLSPWFDLALEGESLRANAGMDYLNEHMIRAAVQMYSKDHDARDPLISPLYADLQGLPPLLIQSGTVDMLIDDAKRFAQRAKAAGVTVELELAENMVHVFQFFYLVSPEARQAIKHIGRFVRAYTGKESNEARAAENHAERHHKVVG
jgi:monoterpene epsilon-lactone hydrolase